MNKRIYIVIVLFLVAIIGFSAYQIISGLNVYRGIDDYYDTVDEQYMVAVEPMPEVPVEAEPSIPEEVQASEPVVEASVETEVVEVAPIQIDFEMLLADAPDTVGWLYTMDGEINLPVVQGDDNEYYLRRLPNGDYSFGGSLFLDYLATSDFSDTISFVYGHNMRNGSMLQPITAYGKQSYYDAYPVMYLLTPEQNYKLEVFSGYVTDVESEAYTFNFASDEEKEGYIQMLQNMSDFTSFVEVTAQDRILCLSTCTYEYEDARYVVFSKLTPIG